MDSKAQTAPMDSEIINELLSLDSTAQRAPRHSDITNELLLRLTHGFDSQNSTYGL
jgi:hypothetical protein